MPFRAAPAARPRSEPGPRPQAPCASRAALEFRATGTPYVVLGFSVTALEVAKERGNLYVEGSCTDDEDLARAGLERARGLMASSDSHPGNSYIPRTWPPPPAPSREDHRLE